LTPKQKDIYLIIDEFWKNFGYGPSIEDIMRITGEKSKGNISRKMRALVTLGFCKGIKGKARSIRPSYIRGKDIV